MRSLILFFIITTGGMAMENTVKSPYGPLDGQEKQVILEQGTPDEVFASSNPRVQKFVGQITK